MRINLKQTKNPRVKLTPQMSMYDSLGQEWRPFIMYFHTPNVRSSTVNTDELGFRITHFNGCDYSIGGDEVYSNEVSFIVGGSTAFGVGATSDRMTLPSLLSQKSGRLFLNLGGRAFGASQELILFSQVAHKYPRINSVIIFSGLNELYLSRFRHSGGYFGSFYFAEQFKDAMNQSILSPKRKLLKFLLYPIFGEKIDYKRIRQKDLFKIFKSSVVCNSSYKSNTQLFDVDYAVNQLKKPFLSGKRCHNLFRSYLSLFCNLLRNGAIKFSLRKRLYCSNFLIRKTIRLTSCLNSTKIYIWIILLRFGRYVQT